MPDFQNMSLVGPSGISKPCGTCRGHTNGSKEDKKTVIDWPRPIIIYEERSFRGLAGSIAHINTKRRPIIKELHELIEQRLQLKVAKKCLLAQFRVRSVYLDRVKAT